MTTKCPHCEEALHIDPNMFAPGDVELIEYCHRCDGEIVVRRRPAGYEYTVEKA